jgi:hypothetical protein
MNRAINVLALLFTLCVSAVADDYIVIVLDTSGSMNQMMSGGKKRMETAQDALNEVLSKVPDSTNVGIITFRGWIYELGPVDRAQLSEAIRSTRPSGGTPLYAALSMAATELLKKREAQGNIGYYKLLAVTDGAAGDANLNQESSYPDGSPKLGVLQEIIQRGIVVDTIGLDMAGSHSLSKLINGAYMSGDDPQSLTEAVSKAVAEIGFGDGRDTSEDAFEEIGEIPESFAMATTLGLTTYSNQPIGQHAPESIDASRSSNQPATTTGSNTGPTQRLLSGQNPPVAQQEPGGIGAVWIAILAFGILWMLCSLFLRR